MTKRTRRRKLRANHWQTIALMAMVIASLIINVIAIHRLVFINSEHIINGDLNYTHLDDKTLMKTGNQLRDNVAYIICSYEPYFSTRNLITNMTWDTTKCIKISNVNSNKS